jgi:3-dehydroquinate synthase
MSSPISSELASAGFRNAEIRPVEVTAGASTYQAIVGPDTLDRLGEWLDRAGLGGQPRIIADAHVWAVHGQRIETSLRATGRDARVALVPSGEEQKSLAGAERLYDWLLEVGTDRGDCIIAIGGGVVGDLGGFVAATFLRGLRLVQVPTTLLAQVDSSIGGKVAVNHRLGKNLIGAFHQPSLVVSDTNILRGLPEREYQAGWAEIVKIAMIEDADLFRALQAHVDSLLTFGDEALLGDVIRRAVELKALVVGEDEREDGRRVILNYGHTVGHALEAATGYHRYLHGEAVAIGMAAAGFLANRRGVLSDAALAEQTALLAAFGLPSRADGVAVDDLLGPLSRDKKARGKTIQWVLAPEIGQVTTVRDVTPEEVEAALRSIGCR